MSSLTRWNLIEIGIAAVGAAMFIAFRFLPGAWCEPPSVRLVAGLFVVLMALLYIALVDDEARPKAKSPHRVAIGAAAGLVVAAISAGTLELYALFGLIGAIAGYVGIFWLKHVRI